MGFMDNLRRGLERSRETLSEIFYMGGEVTEEVDIHLLQTFQYL